MKRLNLQIIWVMLGILALSFSISAQTAKIEKPKVKITVQEEKVKVKTPKPEIVISDARGFSFAASSDGEPIEKAIAVSPKTNVSLCVGNGNLKVRGWARNEVRVYIEGGSKLGFRVMQSDDETKLPVWLMILGFEKKTKQTIELTECFYGENIEIEMPYGATLDVKGTDGNWRIENINKVRAQNVAGNVTLRNINRGIDASSQSGDVVAEDSAGQISLKSIAGEVRAVRVKPNEIGDSLRVGSHSGQVLLRDVKHLSVEGGSTGGEFLLFGTLAINGNYELNTVTGSVSLFLPADSSFQINAVSSFGGSIFTDFALKSVSDIKEGKTRRMNGTFGTGEANIKMTSFNGSLSIKKK